jgi:hypothetical protein
MALDVLKGMTPTRKRGAGYNSAGFNTYPIANGYASNIGEGDPVKLSAGVIQLADNDSVCLGVFGGVRYIDADGRLQFKKNFVAGTSSKGGLEVEGGYTQPLANVYDDEGQTYIVRTHTSALAATDIGTSYRMSAIGSVVNGRSQAVLQTTSAGTSTGDGHMVTVLGLWTGQSSEWGTGPIAVEVKLSNPGIVGEL